MYVKAYSEYMAYSDIFRTVASFRQVIQYYSRAIYAYSKQVQAHLRTLAYLDT